MAVHFHADVASPFFLFSFHVGNRLGWSHQRRLGRRYSAQAKTDNAAGVEFFEKRIRPLLAAHCYECHGPEEQEGELRLDRYADMLQGGLSGKAVVPGKATASLLLTAVRYTDNDLQMPPEEKLSKEQIADS